MGHDLGHGCEAIEPGSEGKRPAITALFAISIHPKSDGTIAIKIIAKTTPTVVFSSTSQDRKSEITSKINDLEKFHRTRLPLRFRLIDLLRTICNRADKNRPWRKHPLGLSDIETECSIALKKTLRPSLQPGGKGGNAMRCFRSMVADHSGLQFVCLFLRMPSISAQD